MITAQEVHIEIQQQTQKIASNVFDKFLPEEIDWIYNKNEARFIESNVRPKGTAGRFEINEASLDDLQTILVKDYEAITFKQKDGLCYGVLPDNYTYLVNDRSLVLSNCSSLFTTNTSTYSEVVGKLKFPNSTKLVSPYYSTFNIIINGITVFDIADYNISSGLSSVNEKFVLVNLVREELIDEAYTIYWERYRDVYERNTFIIVSNSAMTGSITIDSVTNSMTTSISTYNIYDPNVEVESNNRLTKSNRLPDVLFNNVFHKSIPRSPVSNLVDGKIFVNYSEKRFIVNKLLIDYIRRPQKLSLILDNSSELPETAVRKICDLSAEYIKVLVESPAYQQKLQDNMVRME